MADGEGRGAGIGRKHVERVAAARSLLEPAEASAAEIARLAGVDASVDPSLLGDYVRMVLHAATQGGRLHREAVESCRRVGEEAARGGVALSALLDLYLSATWRLWAEVIERTEGSDPAVVGTAAAAVLRAADDAAAALADGYEAAQRQAIRQEEATRREFVDDLLRGGGDSTLLAERATRLGFSLAAEHAVAVARTHRSLVDAGPVHVRIESHVLATPGGKGAVVATKEGLLVCVFPGSASERVPELLDALEGSLEGPWQVALGRPHAGPGGVARSYEEAREALELAGRLELELPIIEFESLLPYRLLVEDRQRLGELVDSVLEPLERARGGAGPLITTLEALFAEGGNVSATARRLHLSTRAVAYRLERIRDLTGHAPGAPEGAFVLQLAVKGMRLLAEPRGSSDS